MEKLLMHQFTQKWLSLINSTVGAAGRGRNKLRTYCTFKREFFTENYCKLILPLQHRAALSKFRCGVAPIRLEIGRYENLSVEERKCPFCNIVESECHVLLECTAYDDYRRDLFTKAMDIDNTFVQMSNDDKLKFVLSNTDMIRHSAKTCLILKRRQFSVSK